LNVALCLRCSTLSSDVLMYFAGHAQFMAPRGPARPPTIAGFKSVAGRPRCPCFGPEEQAGWDAGAAVRVAGFGVKLGSPR
jgi:hypothetical protein